MNEIQNTIYEYITAHVEAGVPLEEIEKILEKSKTQGNYTSSDIMSAVNKAFENQLVVTFKKKDVTDQCRQTEELQTTNYKLQTRDSTNHAQQVFIKFLQKNPNHTLSTTEVYRQIGLSARKGTQAKKALEEKGLIKIEAIKYDKGWKKIIRLTQ